MKKVCILGAGMVSMPIIRFLVEKKYELSIASNDLSRVEKETRNYPNAHLIMFDINDDEHLTKLVKENDIVVSLLPYAFHPVVAKKCIAYKKNMLTASYISPAMQALDKEAKESGILILNELGLDPGIDHMSAMRIIDHIHAKGGKVEEFYSLCGALIAPESSHDNPLRYKFSWSPKGVVLASNNSAVYKKQGKIITTPTENLFKDIFTVDFPGLETLDVYPNRDSLSYIDIYGIPEAKTIYRGTLRYKGWCESLDALKQLNLTLPTKEDMTGLTYRQYLASKIKASETEDVKQKLAHYLRLSPDSVAVKAIEFLGFLSDKPMNRTFDSAYEITSDAMIERMMQAPHERDITVMQHNFIATYPDGKSEMIESRLLDYGIPNGDTSIARTVSYPLAIGVEMLANNQLKLKGVYRPTLPEIYNTILDNLCALGIKMEESFGLDVKDMIDR